MTDELFTLTGPQRAAYTLLFDAPLYHRRPCKDDPKAWDNTDPAGNAAAIAGCRACPVLAQCRAVANTGVEVAGVMAARVHGSAEPRTIPDSTKTAALHRYGNGEPATSIAASLGLNRDTVLKWARDAEVPKPLPAHGTRTRYNRGCRCDPCRTANSTKTRKQAAS